MIVLMYFNVCLPDWEGCGLCLAAFVFSPDNVGHCSLFVSVIRMGSFPPLFLSFFLFFPKPYFRRRLTPNVFLFFFQKDSALPLMEGKSVPRSSTKNLSPRLSVSSIASVENAGTSML